MWSASSSVGGRVCGVIVSSPWRSPMVSASLTRIQPVGVRHVVARVFVPGSYWRAAGELTPNGPSRNDPAWRSRRLANTLGASKRGTHSQSTDPSGATRAPVWQFDRNAYSAIGGNGDGAAALGGTTAAVGGAVGSGSLAGAGRRDGDVTARCRCRPVRTRAWARALEPCRVP
jgi:hypothetical protein